MLLRRLSLPAALLGSVALAACSADRAFTPAAPQFSAEIATADAGAAIDDQYLVRFKGNGAPSDFQAKVTALGGQVIFVHAGAGIAAVAGLDGAGADRLATFAGVDAVDADAYTMLEPASEDAVESVPAELSTESATNPAAAFFIGRQWNMTAISAKQAWAVGALGDTTTRVGIIDTGIDYLHRDLVGRVDLAASRSFLSDAENARVQQYFPGAHPIADLNFHGTHVASTVVSNGIVAAGVTSRTKLVGMKVCSPGTAANGFRGSCPTSAVLNALLYSADIGLDVVNMSLGGLFMRRAASARGGNGPSFLATINRVMTYTTRKGTLVIVAAGNDTVDLDHNGNQYAAYCNAVQVVCVSATGPTGAKAITNAANPGGLYYDIRNIDARAVYSDSGTSAITVAAPGGNALPVWAACSGFTIIPAFASCKGRTSIVGASGTSMAAPHATGVAALIVGQVGHNPAQIAARLRQTADDLGTPDADPTYGKGRVNLAHAAGL